MQLTIEELMDIWSRVLGNAPQREQFELWAINSSLEVMKESIVATARKNLQLGGSMPQESRVRFASGVMRNRTSRGAHNEANRAALSMEMEATR